jgi:HAD superfamily hydrolase (TIGR01509 family)
MNQAPTYGGKTVHGRKIKGHPKCAIVGSLRTLQRAALVEPAMNNDTQPKANSLSPKWERSRTTKIRAVAFDMDGLILNTEDLYDQVGTILMERRGRVYREEVRQQMIGLQAKQAFEILIRQERLVETWQDLQKETDSIFEEILPSQLRAMPGLEEFVQEVDRLKLPKCVATSSTHAFARKALGQLNLLSAFDFVITAEDVEQGKPNPDIYLKAASRMSTAVEEMLVLEDSPKGTAAGVSAGAYVVSVPNEHTKKGSFHGCQWIADTLRDSRLYELLREAEFAEGR